MTTEERLTLRRALRLSAFTRVSTTYDPGHGMYREIWERVDDPAHIQTTNTVTISWGVRS